MKLQIFIVLFPLMFSISIPEEIIKKIEFITDDAKIINLLNKNFLLLDEINSGKEKTDTIKFIYDLVLWLVQFYKNINYSDMSDKLYNLKEKLDIKYSNIIDGFLYLDKAIENRVFEYLKEDFDKFSFSNKIFYSETAKTIFQNLRILTYSIEGINAFIEKYSGCKNNNIYAIIISIVQSLKNTATKIGFTFIGASIGSLIPIPYLPTVVGGILGSRLADYFNSQIDFEC